VFYRALLAAREAFKKGKETESVKKLVQEIVEQQPGVTFEYFELADSKNLNLLENVKASDQPIMCIAGFVGEVRLIDNMFVAQE
jgi:pantoate--beta-alanine ligase